MNRMKKTVLAIIAAAACALPVHAEDRDPALTRDDPAGAAQAQDAPAGARREEVRKKIEAIRMWRLTEELKLDEAASARLASVLSSFDQQRKDIRRSQRETMRELRTLLNTARPDEAKLKTALDRMEHAHATMQALRNKELTSAKELLTIEQQARFVLFQAEFMHDMRRMISGARGDGPGMGMGRGPGRGRMQAPEGQQ